MFPPTRAVWCEVFRAVCCNNKSPVASNTNNKLPVVGGGLSRRQKSPQIQETSRRDKSRLVCSGLYFIIINFFQGSFEAWICGISDCRGITLICRIFHLFPFFLCYIIIWHYWIYFEAELKNATDTLKDISSEKFDSYFSWTDTVWWSIDAYVPKLCNSYRGCLYGKNTSSEEVTTMLLQFLTKVTTILDNE